MIEQINQLKQGSIISESSHFKSGDWYELSEELH